MVERLPGPTRVFVLRPFLLALLLSATGTAAAQEPSGPAGYELAYGPHVAGFNLVEALDSTRAFRPLRSFRGSLAAEPARPIQVSVWYPADSAVDLRHARPMRAGDFRLLRESEVNFDRRVDDVDGQRLRAEYIARATSLGVDSATATATWDESIPVVRDAPPRPGRHPTVIYFTSAGVSNPELPAYLASHGFVVASFPSNGRMTEATLEYTPNPLTLDTDINDAGFVYALLRRLPYADTRRLAVASFSAGSLASLLWVMRDMQAAAIITVEGWERYRRGADIIAESVHYEPHRLRVPYLMIERAADEASPSFAKVSDVVAALPYAAITRVAFRDAAHVDFLSHSMFGYTEDHARIFRTSARMIRTFLRQTLGVDSVDGVDSMPPSAAVFTPPDGDPFFTVSRDSALGPVPTEEELYRLAETDLDALLSAYEQAKSMVPEAALFREDVLTRAATFAPRPEAQATIMRVVVDAYPLSTSARFRLGQALINSGEEEAKAQLQSALEVVESDPSLTGEAREEWRERIRATLQEDTP